ncbi:REP-associated tyrosine transposase [Legionella shakespearei]|uniref:Transposase IS200 like protein n=1 Tax=Legionella shakespearei DSM 23087 TaxID=1122169 RepID=A0A0W0Z626_9GAMM|nr:transposase [Legionella shakespearei]KTD64604.1 Transposase IS200 like protein [Legionella shakespearei DSM 23087]
MVYYRRDYSPGASYFFTLTLIDRQSAYLTKYISNLSDAFRIIRAKSNFITHAMVVLPDHLHCLWQLPLDDSDYSNRIRLIKTHFTQSLLRLNIPLKKNVRGNVNLWQTRFWEHRIRDEKDFQMHVDYIHYNPVKHGYVNAPIEWPYSSIHRYIKKDLISKNWGGAVSG